MKEKVVLKTKKADRDFTAAIGMWPFNWEKTYDILYLTTEIEIEIGKTRVVKGETTRRGLGYNYLYITDITNKERYVMPDLKSERAYPINYVLKEWGLDIRKFFKKRIYYMNISVKGMEDPLLLLVYPERGEFAIIAPRIFEVRDISKDTVYK